jgi:hypothetical protein
VLTGIPNFHIILLGNDIQLTNKTQIKKKKKKEKKNGGKELWQTSRKAH